MNVGALARDGGVECRVWAPEHAHVDVVITAPVPARHKLARDDAGYHSTFIEGLVPGARYQYALDDELLPDPASRAQPNGVHRESAVIASDWDWMAQELDGPRARGVRRVRAPCRNVHEDGDIRRGHRTSRRTSRARHHRDRAHAHRRVPGREELGLRRRVPVRRAVDVRRTRRPPPPRRRMPRTRARHRSRRRLQPPRTGRERPRPVRPLLHRPLPHAVGRRAQLRWPRLRRSAQLLRGQRAALGLRLPRRRAAARRSPRDRRPERVPVRGGTHRRSAHVRASAREGRSG